MATPERLIELAGKLTGHERALLLGECEGWGSWMFEAGEYLCSLGLGYTSDGSIHFDTPLAKEMIEHLRAQAQSVRDDK